MKVAKHKVWLAAGIVLGLAFILTYFVPALPSDGGKSITPTVIAVATPTAPPTAIYLAVTNPTHPPTAPLPSPATTLPTPATPPPTPTDSGAAATSTPTTPSFAPTFDPNLLPSPTLPAVYSADFSLASNFSPYTIGEGDISLTAQEGVLRCQPPIGGDGSAELWLAASGSPSIPPDASVTIIARLRSQGEPIGLIFDYTPTGGQLVRLAGGRGSTSLSVDRYVGNNTRYPGDGHFGPAGDPQTIPTPFTNQWHTIALTLATGQYQLKVDDAATLSGARRGSGGAVMLYATCDGAEFDTFTITTSE